MHTLVVTKSLPWPPNSGEKQRTLGIVRGLRTLGPVTVVGYAGPHEEPDLARADDVSVTWVETSTLQPVSWLVRSLRLRSITAARWSRPDLARAVAHEVARGVDAVVVEHVQLAALLPALPDDVATVLDMHNVESVLTRRLADTTGSWRRLVYRLESWALAGLERRTAPRFDLVTVVSDADRELLARVAGPDRVDRIEIVPNAIDASRPAPPDATSPTACYVGLMSWAPNAEAAVAFAQSVWPLVRHDLPEARLLIVGRDPTDAVRALAGDPELTGVTVTGTVADIEPWYAQSRVALAPLLAGGGSRLKILEALARGRPVVATPVGAEGLEDLIGRGVLTGTDPEELAGLVVDLLRDPDRAAELGRCGAEAVATDHSWGAATAPLLRELGRHDDR